MPKVRRPPETASIFATSLADVVEAALPPGPSRSSPGIATVFGRPGLGWMVENHPGAGLGAGGVDRGVPGDRARADRAAEGFAPEVRQGGGVGGVDGQGGEAQADGGGHDGFLPVS